MTEMTMLTPPTTTTATTTAHDDRHTSRGSGSNSDNGDTGTTNHDDVQLYEDLKQFLLAPVHRPDLRRAATEAVLLQVLPRNNNNNNNNNEEEAVLAMVRYPGMMAALAQNCSFVIDQTTTAALAASTNHSDQYYYAVSIQALQALLLLTTRETATAQAALAALLFDDDDDDNSTNKNDNNNNHGENEELKLSNESTAPEPEPAPVVRGFPLRLLEIVLDRPPVAIASATTTTTTATTASASTSADIYIQKAWRQRVHLAMSLLANLTRWERGALHVTGRTLPEKAIPSAVYYHQQQQQQQQQQQHQGSSTSASRHVPHQSQQGEAPMLQLLLSRFLDPTWSVAMDASQQPQAVTHWNVNKSVDQLSAVVEEDYVDPFEHFATVLMNCTQLEAGRQFVMKQRPNSSTTSRTTTTTTSSTTTTTTTTVLQRILPMLQSSINPIRRRGIAGTARNCCLASRDSAWWLLHQVHITRHLLYPLAGPEALDVDEKKGLHVDLWLEGPDKVREPDPLTRLWLVEAILLLCTTGRASRQQLRLDKVYVILKYADMVEEQEDISARINECVQFLRRDEQGTEEGSSDAFVQNAYRPTPKSAMMAPQVQLSFKHDHNTTTTTTTNEDLDAID